MDLAKKIWHRHLLLIFNNNRCIYLRQLTVKVFLLLTILYLVVFTHYIKRRHQSTMGLTLELWRIKCQDQIRSKTFIWREQELIMPKSIPWMVWERCSKCYTKLEPTKIRGPSTRTNPHHIIQYNRSTCLKGIPLTPIFSRIRTQQPLLQKRAFS